jgi:hypothetical protein
MTTLLVMPHWLAQYYGNNAAYEWMLLKTTKACLLHTETVLTPEPSSAA